MVRPSGRDGRLWRAVVDGGLMKNAFRQSMAWLHTWAGLLVGWVLFFMFLTGTAGYFDTEIDRWMRPEQPLVTERLPVEQSVATALKRLEEVAPEAERWFIGPPVSRESPDLRITWRQLPAADGKSGSRGNELLDPATGKPIEARDTGGGQVLYRMHYDLHYLPVDAANWLVGACTMFMFVAMITGIVVHKKIFKDFFTFRPGKQQRSWLDAHNVLSVVALPFHLMITYSGLIFFAFTWMPLIVSASYGSGDENRQVFFDDYAGRRDVELERAGVAAPLTALSSIVAEAERRFGTGRVRFLEIHHPGDANARISVARLAPGPLRPSERMVFDGVSGKLLWVQDPLNNAPQGVRDVFLGLHEGLFAGPVLRWLYFLAGLLGTAMIATGLVLWTTKRREQRAAEGASKWGLTLVERLNIGTIVGLPIGIVVYFWANRLIPASFENRAAWEVHAMFIAWAAMLVHAHCRPTSKAWVEQFWIAAGLCVFLPVLNAITTQRHLGVTVPGGDWVLAGFDLTMLALGFAFAATALRLQKRALTAPAARRVRVSQTPPATHAPQPESV
jgi:uncharacterized iron-regulated membrane protein